MKTILFIDRDETFIKEINKLDWSSAQNKNYIIKSQQLNITKIKSANDTIFVSPANSFASMGGGLDGVYDRYVFPNVSDLVQNRISKFSSYKSPKYNQQFDYGIESEKKYLPVGSSLLTQLSDYKGFETCYLATCPTMFVPMSVKNSNNAYKAFLSLLCVLEKSKVKHDQIICTALCTGVGEMSYETSVKQIHKAFNDFLKGIRIKDISKENMLVLV